MAVHLRVNTKELEAYAKKLKSFSKTALPRAVKDTLNEAAKDTKKITVPKLYPKLFTVRGSVGYIKSRTRVEFAKGSKISDLISRVGIIPKGSKDSPANNFKVHEEGGSIKSEFIPLTESRISRNPDKKIAKKNRLSNIDLQGRVKLQKHNKKGLYTQAHKAGQGRYIQYGNNLVRVESVKRLKNGNTNVRLKFLYKFEENRRVTPSKRRKLFEKSVKIRGKKLDQYFTQMAKKRIEHELGR